MSSLFVTSVVTPLRASFSYHRLVYKGRKATVKSTNTVSSAPSRILVRRRRRRARPRVRDSAVCCIPGLYPDSVLSGRHVSDFRFSAGSPLVTVACQPPAN